MRLLLNEKYTSFYGVVEFKDGLSVNTVTVKDANLLRAIISGVKIMEDDGVTIDANLNPIEDLKAREFYTSNGVPVPSIYLPNMDGSYPKEATPVAITAAPVSSIVPGKAKYTREQLEAVADAKGIQGLRDVAGPSGPKSNSVRGLIAALLGSTLEPEVDPIAVTAVALAQILTPVAVGQVGANDETKV